MWYALNIERDGDTWLVTSPDFEEITTFGDSRKDASRWGLDAILQAIAGRIADGEHIPPPHPSAGDGAWVELPALVLLKASLYTLMRQRSMTRADLMRKLGWKRTAVDRLFQLNHNSRIDVLEEAFRALDAPLRFDVPFANAA